ncbi:MAG: hypothetical protein L3J12_04345, partial [Spirochaetales bacterium]|nr:hypothetical protein [Spirochaetales bacterium]
LKQANPGILGLPGLYAGDRIIAAAVIDHDQFTGDAQAGKGLGGTGDEFIDVLGLVVGRDQDGDGGGVSHDRGQVARDSRRLWTMVSCCSSLSSAKIGKEITSAASCSETGKLPVPNVAAGGIATPADASLMMQLGAETIFVGSGIFKSEDPAARAKAIVTAVSNYRDPEIVARVSKNLKEAMPGLEISTISENELMAKRGW